LTPRQSVHFADKVLPMSIENGRVVGFRLFHFPISSHNTCSHTQNANWTMS